MLNTVSADLGYHCINVADACAASEAHLQQPALDMLLVESGIFGEVIQCAAALAKFPAALEKNP